MTAIAGAGELPGRRVSTSFAFEEGSLGIAFRVEGAALSAGAGLCLALDGFEPGAPYAEMESDECAAFIGIGRFRDGRAIRSLPGSPAGSRASALWNRDSRGGEALSVFGIAGSGLRFVVLADASCEGSAAGEASASGYEGASASNRFRFCAVEAGTSLGDRFAIDGGLSVAARPEEESGEGWRRGAALKPATSLLSAAVAARCALVCAGLPIDADAWLSCEAGSLAEPGAALSLRITTGGSPGAFSGASLWLFAASGRFLTALAEPPPRDFIADMKAGFRAGPARLSLGIAAASLQGDGPGRLAKASGVSLLDRLLWQWRTDMVTLSIEAGCGALVLLARGSIDSAGPKDGLLTLRLAPTELAGRGDRRVEFSGGLSARFARVAAATSEDEDDEGGWDDEEEDEYAAVEASLADFALRSLRGEGGLAWNPPKGRMFGRGGAKLSLAARPADGAWAFALSGSLSQAISIVPGVEFSLGIKSPSGGYGLDAAPAEIPRFFLDCAFALP